MYGHDVESVVEIFTEGSVGHCFFEIAVRRRQDAGIDPDVGFAAEPGELTVLEHLEEFRLQSRMHFADLVEKNGAVIRVLELAQLSPQRPGEGPLFKTEQLALEQFRGQRRTIHLYEWIAASAGESVEPPCHQLLTGAAFTPNQNRDVGVRDLLDHLAEFEHFRIVSEQTQNI